MAEPRTPDRLGHLDGGGSGLARDPGCDLFQDPRSTSRRCDGAPGDFIGERPVSSFIHPAGLPINNLLIKVLRRPVESALYRVVNGTYARLAEVAGLGLVSSGGSYLVRLEAVDDLVRVLVDGVLLIEHQQSSSDAVTFATARGAGLRTYRSSAADDGGSRCDDVRIESISV